MKRGIISLALLGLLAGPCVATCNRAEPEGCQVYPGGAQGVDWRLAKMGTRTTNFPDGRPSTVVALYKITIGDTTSADERSVVLQDLYIGVFAQFALDAAAYLPNPDGSWRIEDFRPPNGTPGQEAAWRLYLDNDDVVAILKDPFKARDFGAPGDFIYLRSKIDRAELPPPFNRMDRGALAPVEGIFVHHLDGTIKVMLSAPDDEEGRAQKVLANFRKAD